MSVSTYNFSVRELVVEGRGENQRLDNFLVSVLKGVPRSRIYRIVRTGEVRVNGGRVKAGHRLQIGDRVRIPPLRIAEPKATAGTGPNRRVIEILERSILFEDERILVIDKPAGMAVHGGSGLSWGVIEGLRQLFPGERDLELVHRLDRDTSGCLLISKRRSALRILHELLRSGAVEKRYNALLYGLLARGRADVRAPLAKNVLQGGERVVRVDDQGKPAHTAFRTVEVLGDATFVEARLFTGRTHQIRVHAAHIGNPVLGDEKYGCADGNRIWKTFGLRRLFLHAASLKWTWPDESEAVSTVARLPKELLNVLEQARKKL